MLKHVKFANLPVSDQERALAFYRDRLGLTVATDAAYGGGWRWIELELPGARTRILFTQPETVTPGEQPVLILVCDDLDATHRELAGRGVEFTQAPVDAPWAPGERYAILRDSEGNLVLLNTA
jgi:predicted enzyme related to lactoylglutathione lyase